MNKCAMLNAILNVDIVFIVETFLTPDIPSNEVFLGYQVFRKDISRKRGGVLIAAKQGLSISQCYPDDGDLENLW